MRTHLQVVFRVVVTLWFIGAPVNGEAADPLPCASVDEARAFNVRNLQSQFMVAALACNQREAYNKFVTRFQSYLKIANIDLVNYFSRTGGGRAAVNRHVTDLANAAGLKRAENPASYCTKTWKLLWMLEYAPQDLMKAATANSMPSASRPRACVLN